MLRLIRLRQNKLKKTENNKQASNIKTKQNQNKKWKNQPSRQTNKK